MNNKKKIILISSVIIVILFAVLYVSYGYITTIIEGNETSKIAVFNSQIIKVEYSGGTESIQDAHILDENGNENTYFVPGSTLTKTFTVKNTGNVAVKYSINLTEISNDFERPEDLYYEISESGTVLNSGTFPQSDTYIVSKDTLDLDASKTYTLTIKYLTSEENQIIDQGKVINAKVTINETVKTISKLNIYGNSIQDGTPSLESPVEVESLGTTKNLFDESLVLSGASNSDANLIKTKKGYEANHYPTVYNSSSALVQHLKKVIKPNVTYTLSRYVTGYVNNSSGAITIRNSSEALVTVSYGNGLKSVTFTLTQEQIDSISNIYIYGQRSTPVYYEYIQLEEGDTATDYEPYGKYKIPISITGKNLFNIEDVAKNGFTFRDQPTTHSTIKDGVITANMGYYDGGTYTKTDLTSNLKAGTYTLSADVYYPYNDSGDTPKVVLAFRYIGSSGVSTLNQKFMIVEHDVWKKVSFTFTFTEDVEIVGWIFVAGGSAKKYTNMGVQFKNIMLEKNSTVTDFENFEEINANIYLDQPLRKVGTCNTCADYLDVANGQVIRNVYEGDITKAFIERSNATQYNSIYTKATDVVRFGYNISNLGFNKPVISSDVLSKHFVNEKAGWHANNENIFVHTSQNQNFYIGYLKTRLGITDEDTDDQIKEKQVEYIKNNDIKIYYQLETTADPEAVELPKIEALKGTNNISICSDNGVCASNIEVEYDE